MRPISNVVDVTNYVMLALGNPLHAFDHAKLAQAADRRPPRADGEQHPHARRRASAGSTPTDLVIADAERAIALAGIMGGEETRGRRRRRPTSCSRPRTSSRSGSCARPSGWACAPRARTAGRRASTRTSPSRRRRYATELLVELTGARWVGRDRRPRASCRRGRSARCGPSAPTRSLGVDVAARASSARSSSGSASRLDERAGRRPDLARPRRHARDRPRRGGLRASRPRRGAVHAAAPPRDVRPAHARAAAAAARRGRARRRGALRGVHAEPRARRSGSRDGCCDPMHDASRPSCGRRCSPSWSTRRSATSTRATTSIALFEIARVYLPSRRASLPEERLRLGADRRGRLRAREGRRRDALRRAARRARASSGRRSRSLHPGQGGARRGRLVRRAAPGPARGHVGRVRARPRDALRRRAAGAAVRGRDHLSARPPGPRVHRRRGRARR